MIGNKLWCFLHRTNLESKKQTSEYMINGNAPTLPPLYFNLKIRKKNPSNLKMKRRKKEKEKVNK